MSRSRASRSKRARSSSRSTSAMRAVRGELMRLPIVRAYTDHRFAASQRTNLVPRDRTRHDATSASEPRVASVATRRAGIDQRATERYHWCVAHLASPPPKQRPGRYVISTSVLGPDETAAAHPRRELLDTRTGEMVPLARATRRALATRGNRALRLRARLLADAARLGVWHAARPQGRASTALAHPARARRVRRPARARGRRTRRTAARAGPPADDPGPPSAPSSAPARGGVG